MSVILGPDGRPYRSSVFDSPGSNRHDARDPDLGTFALPHVLTFGSLVGSAQRAYLHARQDEAYRQSRENALAMRRDLWIMGLLQERVLAVSTLKWHIQAPDDKDRHQLAAAKNLTHAIEHTGYPYFNRFRKAHLEALWYGRYGCQAQYDWMPAPATGKPGMQSRKIRYVRKWAPVNGDKIGYTWNDIPYVLINASRGPSLPSARTIWTTGGMGLLLLGEWRKRFLLHHHQIEDADFFDWERSDAIHGVGLRDRAHWINYVKMEFQEWIATYMERVGLGVELWHYDASNPQSEAEVERAAKRKGRRTIILVPTWPDSRTGQPMGGVERIETPVTGVEALRTLIDKFDEYMERYFVGQSLSGGAESTGMGSEVAKLHKDTKQNIIVDDAMNHADSMTGCLDSPGLLSVLLHDSYPEFRGYPFRFVYDIERTESKEKLDAISTVHEKLKIPIKADEARAAAGLSKPTEDDEVIQPEQEQQPGAMPGMPAPGGAPGMPASPGAPPPQSGQPTNGTNGHAQDPLAALLSERMGKGALKFEWTPYQGPMGGKGFKDSETGDVVYGDTMPGERHSTPREGAGPHDERSHVSGPAPRRKLLGAAGAGVLSAIRKAHHKVQDVEKVAGDYWENRVDENIEAIPRKQMRSRVAAAASWWLLKLGTRAAFATYTLGQHLAEEVAKERGATPEQQATLKKWCTGFDLGGAKGVPATLAMAGLGAVAGPAAMLPAGSTAYLAYSTVRAPRSTGKAVGRAVARGVAEGAQNAWERLKEAKEAIVPIIRARLAKLHKEGPGALLPYQREEDEDSPLSPESAPAPAPKDVFQAMLLLAEDEDLSDDDFDAALDYLFDLLPVEEDEESSHYAWQDKGLARDGRRHKWYDPDTKRTRTQISEPGTWRAKHEETKAARPTVAKAQAHVSLHLSDPSKITEDSVGQLYAYLRTMTRDDLRKLAKEQGKSTGGKKSDLAYHLAERAVAAVGERKPKAAESHEKTLAEYVAAKVEKARSDYDAALANLKKIAPREAQRGLEELKRDMMKGTSHRPEVKKAIGDYMGANQALSDTRRYKDQKHSWYWDGHRKAVEAALAAGKPVPPEVLADYPDLAKAGPSSGLTPPGQTEAKPAEKTSADTSLVEDLYNRSADPMVMPEELMAAVDALEPLSLDELREMGKRMGLFMGGARTKALAMKELRRTVGGAVGAYLRALEGGDDARTYTYRALHEGARLALGHTTKEEADRWLDRLASEVSDDYIKTMAKELGTSKGTRDALRQRLGELLTEGEKRKRGERNA